MKALWTVLKVVIGLMIAVPLSIIVLVTALGVLGALFGVAMLALKFAVFALVGYAAFRFIARLTCGPSSARRKRVVAQLPSAPVDPHYEAAMRELDRELGHVGTER